MPQLDELLEQMASYVAEAEALDARIQELKGGAGLRQYLPERLGGLSPDDQQDLEPSGMPELDELLEQMASHMAEAEALDVRIQELRGGAGLRQYLPESLGGLSPDAQRDLTPSGLPELDELMEQMASHMAEAEALDARIQELKGGAGLRQYLPESLGGVSPAEELIAAEARREEVSAEMQAIESRVRAMEEEQLAAAESRRQAVQRQMDATEEGIRLFEGELLSSAEARREAVSAEMQTIESRVRAMEEEQLASAEARRQEIRREMDAVEERIRAFEGELLSSAEARREEVSGEMQTIESRVRAMEEEQLASAEARRQEVRREMDAVEEQIGAFQEELLSSTQARREEVSAGMETAQSQIQVVEEELECIEKTSAGGDCVSLLGNLSAMAQEGYARIRDLVGRSGEIVAATIKLMIFVIVKNILLPIAFLMIAVKCALPVARYGARLTSDFRRDVKELAATVSPNPGGTRLPERSEGA